MAFYNLDRILSVLERNRGVINKLKGELKKAKEIKGENVGVFVESLEERTPGTEGFGDDDELRNLRMMECFFFLQLPKKELIASLNSTIKKFEQRENELREEFMIKSEKLNAVTKRILKRSV